MALADYTDLQAAIGTWSFNRSDLPATDIIALAENRLNRDLKLRNASADYPLTGVVDSRFIALPTGYTQPVALWIELENGRTELELLTPDHTTFGTSGQPWYWAVEGNNIGFEKPCAETFSFTLRCYTYFALSDSSPTNWLLTNYPDTYLAASLVEAALWMQDDDQAQRWQARYQVAIDALKSLEAQSLRQKLRTDIPQRGRFDINTGGFGYSGGDVLAG